MTSRGRAVMWPIVIFLSSLASFVGCRREPTETLQVAVKETEDGEKASTELERYFSHSPPKPPGVAFNKTLRVIAPAGWLDRYELVDLKRDHVARSAELFVEDDQGAYVPIERKEATAHAADRKVYVYVRAPAIVRFEHDYGIKVQLEHFTEDEVQYTGLQAARARYFDLVFGPQSMLPLVLAKDNLAPFEVSALTRYGPVRTYITEALGRLPPDLDWEFCVPYFRYPVGVRFNQTIVSGIPRQWSDCFEFERNEFYWHRVKLRRNPFILLGAAALYQKTLTSEQLQKVDDSTRRLLTAVAALAADPAPAENKAVRLETLRKQFTLGVAAGPAANAFGGHTATFTTVVHSGAVAAQFRDFEVDHPDQPQLRAVDVVGSAADFVKRLMVFGADFYDERTAVADTGDTDWAYTIGSSGDPYAGLRTDPRFLFSIPGPTSIVGLDVFLLPAGRSELDHRTAEFFVDFLLIPEVAASMTEFSLKATLVREAIEFLPVEMTKSEIFALPEREDVVYLPIMSGDSARFKQLWQDLQQFRNTIRAIDETPAGRRATAAAKSRH